MNRNDMKQTAVEFLVDNLHYLHSTKWDDIIEQAKEMEKEQIGNAYVYGSAYGIDLKNGFSPNNYYNETFNK